MSSVAKPRMLFIFITVPTKANSRASATPVTISGFVSGIFVTPIVKLRSRGPMAWMPRAAQVPSMVAKTEDNSATIRELSSSGSRTPSTKSSL